MGASHAKITKNIMDKQDRDIEILDQNIKTLNIYTTNLEEGIRREGELIKDVRAPHKQNQALQRYFNYMEKSGVQDAV